MATQTTFTADMLKEMMKAVEDYRSSQSLFVSGGMRRQMEATVRSNAPTLTDNPILSGYTESFLGIIPFETVDIPPEEVIDWSGCRSPSRAKRRHARGIPQRVKITYRERAFLLDKSVLTDFAIRFDRMAVKMLLVE